MEDPRQLRDAVLTWAALTPDVQAVIQTGSRGRGTRVDAFSDLDLEIITPNWWTYHQDIGWPGKFGEVLLNVSFDEERWHSEGEYGIRLVVFRQGRKIDFTLASPLRIETQIEHGLNELYQRGYTVHFDRNGITACLPAPTGIITRPLPTAADVQACVEEFWFEATQLPIYIARNDLWVVKLRVPSLQNRLLQMLEWYGQTNPDGPRDTWHIGHYMKEWLPAEVYQRVEQCFAGFDAADSYRALLAICTLFRDITENVTGRLGYSDSLSLANVALGLVTGYATHIGQSTTN